MTDRLWILIANASRARLFAKDEGDDRWVLVEQFEHRQSREHSQALGERVNQPAAGTLNHAVWEDEPQARQEMEGERFARELCERLARGVDDQAFGQLLLAASPHFLGLLRRGLAPRVQQRLWKDLHFDYTQVPARELAERVDA